MLAHGADGPKNIASDKGLLPDGTKTITCTNTGLLLLEPFGEISIKIQCFYSMK